MIIRGQGRGKLFIQAEKLWAVRHYDGDLILEFTGFTIEINSSEETAIREALAHLDKNPRDNLVFEDEGEPYQRKYKMMRWNYDSEKNHGGPVEIQSSEKVIDNEG